MSSIIIKQYNKNQKQFLYKIRNRNFVRKFSVNKKIIKKKDHDNWINKFKQNKRNKIILIYNSKTMAGYIRINFHKERSNVSWALEKKFHNKGIMSKELLNATKDNKRKFKCLIHKKNSASIKVAINAKFILNKSIGSYLLFDKN